MRHQRLHLAVLALLAAGSAQAVNLTATGYAESFDSMGTSGTTPPTGWSLFTGPSGTSNSTWTTTISAAGVGAMVATSGPLTATTSPTATNNNGYNTAYSGSATSDRLIATSPTTTSGSAIQLSLTNATGGSFSDLLVGFDIRRYTAPASVNELPGYWFFFSLNNGTSWNNAAALNSTVFNVPNSLGNAAFPLTQISLGSAVTVGSTVLLRWVDDNAVQSSPDQIIGLNNVVVQATAVPEPSSVALMFAGLGLVGWMGRRRASEPKRA